MSGVINNWNLGFVHCFCFVLVHWCPDSFFLFSFLFLFLSVSVANSLPIQRFCRARSESYVPLSHILHELKILAEVRHIFVYRIVSDTGTSKNISLST